MPREASSPERAHEPLHAVTDLKGAQVMDAHGHYAGELFGALAEVDSGLLRYLDLALFDADRHVLVPIGHARVDRKAEGRIEVQLRAATREELKAMPPFVPGQDTGGIDHETLLETAARAFSGERYYAHPAFDHGRLFVGDRPVVRASTPAEPAPELGLLSEVDGFDVDDEQDVRDWPVQDAACMAIGMVRDMVIDMRAERVRYLLVDLSAAAVADEPPAANDDAADGDTNRGQSRLIPVGYAQLDQENDVVCLTKLDLADVLAIPAYDVSELTRVKEEAICASVRARVASAGRYGLPDFSANA